MSVSNPIPKISNIAKILTLFLFLSFSAVAEAATFTVINTNDSGAGSLRQAIEDANGDGVADEIVFLNVTGEITLVSPLPIISQPVTITGPGSENLTLNANDTGRVLHFYNAAADKEYTLEGMKITGGLLSNGDDGAGIYFQDKKLTVRNCEITGNTGAGNSANGGGIYAFGQLIVENSTISDNQVGNVGGGISIFAGLNPSITNSKILRNKAEQGGGLYLSNTDIVISKTLIQDNKANQSSVKRAGGIFVLSTATLYLNKSTVYNNSSSATAGGIRVEGILYMVSSTVGDNFAGTDAGGIYVTGNGVAKIYSSTIVDNRSNNNRDTSGGILVNLDGSVEMKNSILARNNHGSNPDCKGDLVSLGNNIIGNLDGCSFTASSGDQFGANLLNILDPQLSVSIADNGGDILTYSLLNTSLAIDAGGGDTGKCNNHNDGLIVADQRNFSRYGKCDIGSFEFQGDCGDDLLQESAGEQCDDGNIEEGDTCSSTCQIEFCGDAVVNNDGSEQCDDGNNIDNDGCSAVCESEVIIVEEDPTTDDTTSENSGATASSGCSLNQKQIAPRATFMLTMILLFAGSLLIARKINRVR